MSEFKIKLIQKIVLTERVYLFTFVADTTLGYKPGQFVSLETLPKVYRAYSIAYLDSQAPFFTQNLPPINTWQKRYLSLIISTKPGGLASQFFENISLGTEIKALNISGRFGVKHTNIPKCFICTGTGLAPFIPMIDQSLVDSPDLEINLFFGAWKKNQDFSNQFFSKNTLSKPNFKIYSCIDDEVFTETEQVKMGRVTDLVPQTLQHINNTEFYLCGNPFMIQAMEQRLIELNIPKIQIVKESFGSVRQSSITT